MRISFYGNFGAGNLGNECTLQAIIEKVLQFEPDARLLCFCTNSEDVGARHQIAALPASVSRSAGHGSGARRNRLLSRILRIVLRWIPLELMQWLKSIGPMRRTDVLIIAGTGIVTDLSGPLGWPYEIFRLCTLARIFRIKIVFLSVGAGPINHALSRWFLKRSLGLADFRSYRDVASRDYLAQMGIDTSGDFVCPDVVFGLSRGKLPAQSTGGSERRIIGLGLKDYGADAASQTGSRRLYLRAMADFVSWLHAQGYAVRLLIGDMHYDEPVVREFIALLSDLGVSAQPPLLLVDPVRTVEELLNQLAATDAVISPRYHNLVMGLIQGKPVIALSDHAKLDSLVTDFGLARFRLPLADLKSEMLIARFEELRRDFDRLAPHVREGAEQYRHQVGGHYKLLFEKLSTWVPAAQTT